MINIDKSIGYVPVRFTPEFYRSAFNQYQNGYYRDLIALMKRAAVDSHVAGCLKGRRAGYQRPWSLTPFDNESSKDRNNTEWLKSVLSGLGIRKLLKSIHEAMLYKFVVIDFDWQVRDSRQIPVTFTKFDQKYFRYKEGVLKIDSKTLLDIPETALVCETDEMPEMLPVLRDYILKDHGLESWAGFIEVFGQGIIIGKYPPGSDPKIKQELENAVNAIASASRGIMPDGTSIEVKGYESRIGDHDKFIETANTGISITLLGHENAVSQSKGLQVGENTTSYKVKMEIAVDDMYYIDEHVQRLVKLIWDLNIGDGRYPAFGLDKSEPINVSQRLEVLDQFYNQGGVVNPDHYAELGLKIYPDQEPLQRPEGF